MQMKRTTLFSLHQQLGAKLVEFGGWEMPLRYSGIVDEHLAVRQAAGLFDISHMGEVSITGPTAGAFLNQTLTNDIRKLAPGQGQYTLMCNERGGVIDDLYVYRLLMDEYLLIVNASRIDTDLGWLAKYVAGFPQRSGVGLHDLSPERSALAVQGPRVVEFINECFEGPSNAGTSVEQVTDLRKNQIANFVAAGTPVWVGRTGYTGEDGFEIIAPNEVIGDVWTKVSAAGQTRGLKPAGLGARDTLRTEVCYPLYGHELDEHTTPIEAGLGAFVALDKGEFVGRSVAAEQKLKGPSKRLVAFKMTEKSAPPRPHYGIWSAEPGGSKLGEVTIGTQSPSLGFGIGLGYVPPVYAKPQTPLHIEIRGQRFSAIVVPKPIYRKLD